MRQAGPRQRQDLKKLEGRGDAAAVDALLIPEADDDDGDAAAARRVEPLM
jgi:hypothetical protein